MWYQSPSIGPMRQGPPELSVAAAQYRVSPGFAPTRTAVLDGSSAQPTGTHTGFSLYSHSYTPQIPPQQYYPPSPPSQSFTQNPQFHTQISSMVDSTHSISTIHSHMTHSVYSLPQTPNQLFYTTSQPLQHPRNFHSPCQYPPTRSEIYQHYPPTQPHFIPTNQFAPPPPASEQQRPISLEPDRVHDKQMDARISEMQDSFEAIRAKQSSFRAEILGELGQLQLGPKAPVTESASSPLKFGSLPVGSVTLTEANGPSSTLSASSIGIPISEKPNLNLSPHEVTLGLNKDFTTAFVNGNHSEHTTTAVMTEELVLNVDKNIARGFTGLKFSDSYGSDVANSIVWRNDAQTHCFQHTSFRDGSSAGYGELVSHNHNSVGNIRVDFHEREEKELEDAYGEDDNEDEGENDSTESYGDGESYSDDFQSVDGQIVTDSDEEVVTDDEGSRLCIKKEALLGTMYQSKDPKSLDEVEMLENLFNCLCGLLMPLENRDINAGIKEETSRRDVGDSSLGAASLEPLKLTNFAKQVAEQLFGRADILELIAVCAIFISASVLVGTHDQLFSYYKSSLMKYLRELAHVFDIKGQMEMTNKLCEKLLKQKDQHRDIASIAMKAMVAEVSTQSLAQSILGFILPQSIKGSTAWGMNTEIKGECPDILCYALQFGDIMATDHELLLGALLSQLNSNQKNVRKKSVSCIASLASSLSDDLLGKATVRVVQHLSNKGTKYKMTQTSLSQVFTSLNFNYQDVRRAFESFLSAMIKIYNHSLLNSKVEEENWSRDDRIEKMNGEVDKLFDNWSTGETTLDSFLVAAGLASDTDLIHMAPLGSSEMVNRGLNNRQIFTSLSLMEILLSRVFRVETDEKNQVSVRRWLICCLLRCDCIKKVLTLAGKGKLREMASELILSNGMRVCYKSTKLLDDQVIFAGFSYGGLFKLVASEYFSCSMGPSIAGDIVVYGYRPSILMDMFAGCLCVSLRYCFPSAIPVITTFLLSVTLVMCVTACGVLKTIEKVHIGGSVQEAKKKQLDVVLGLGEDKSLSAILLQHGNPMGGGEFIYDIFCLRFLLDLVSKMLQTWTWENTEPLQTQMTVSSFRCSYMVIIRVVDALELSSWDKDLVKENSTYELAPKYFGPFQVIIRIGKVPYKLELSPTAKVHPVFHVSLLKKKLGDSVITSSHLPPGLTLTRRTGIPDKIVDRGLFKHGNSSVVKWLIKWKNRTEEDSTWKEADSFQLRFPDFKG